MASFEEVKTTENVINVTFPSTIEPHPTAAVLVAPVTETNTSSTSKISSPGIPTSSNSPTFSKDADEILSSVNITNLLDFDNNLTATTAAKESELATLLENNSTPASTTAASWPLLVNLEETNSINSIVESLVNCLSLNGEKPTTADTENSCLVPITSSITTTTTAIPQIKSKYTSGNMFSEAFEGKPTDLEGGSLEDSCSSSTDNGGERNCKLCGNRLFAPRVLSCLHVFCETCLHKLTDDLTSSSSGVSSASSINGERALSPPVKGAIKCPTCKQVTMLDDHGVVGLTPDYLITNILDLSTIESEHLSCTSCKSKEAAISRCSDCAHFLCGGCDKAHKFMRCFENHEVVMLSDLQEKAQAEKSFIIHKPLFCQVHAAENLKYYCFSCQKPVCNDCLIADHKGNEHHYDIITVAEQLVRGDVENLMKEAQSKVQYCDSAAENLSCALTELQSQHDVAQRLIDDTYKKYTKILEKCRDISLAELNKLHSERELKIMDILQNLENMMGNIDSTCKFTSRVLEQANAAEFLSMKKLINCQLVKLINNTPKCEINYSLNFDTKPEKFEQVAHELFGKFRTESSSPSPKESTPPPTLPGMPPNMIGNRAVLNTLVGINGNNSNGNGNNSNCNSTSSNSSSNSSSNANTNNTNNNGNNINGNNMGNGCLNGNGALNSSVTGSSPISMPNSMQSSFDGDLLGGPCNTNATNNNNFMLANMLAAEQQQQQQQQHHHHQQQQLQAQQQQQQQQACIQQQQQLHKPMAYNNNNNNSTTNNNNTNLNNTINSILNNAGNGLISPGINGLNGLNNLTNGLNAGLSGALTTAALAANNANGAGPVGPAAGQFNSMLEYNLSRLASLTESTPDTLTDVLGNGGSVVPAATNNQPITLADILSGDQRAFNSFQALAKIGLNSNDVVDFNTDMTSTHQLLSAHGGSPTGLDCLLSDFCLPSAAPSPSLSAINGGLGAVDDLSLTNFHAGSSGNNSSIATGRNKATPMQIRCKFGSLGTSKGQFNSPHGFCLGVDEEIIVADTNNHRIEVFDKSGTLKFQFGVPGKEEGQLWYPRKVAVMHTNGKFVVCDRGNERSRMQIFSKCGHFMRKIAIRYIDIVAGLAVTSKGHIVAVDSVSPTVFVISEDGELVRWFDCSDFMREPSDIAIRDNDFYVCDFKGHCVAVFQEDGTFQYRIGNEKVTCFPNGIDISNAGDILIGDSHGNRFHVAVYSRDGKLQSEFECPHVKVSRCCGLKITSEGYVVTLAKNNHHVLVLNTLYVH